MNYLTREEAIAEVGEDAVDFVDNIDCQATDRPMENNVVEYEACVDLTKSKHDHLTAYYYQDEKDLKNTEDMGNLDWKVHGYILY